MAISASTRTRLATQLDTLAVILDGGNAGLAEIRPADGGWSAKENVAHLARHAHVFLERLERLLREERPNLGTYHPEQDPEWPSWRSLSLDEALRLWQRGEELYRLCRERLDAAEGKIEELASRAETARP